MDNKAHWENVYATKQPHEVSWTQEYPATSMNFLAGLNLPKTANIIDIGGGDSNFVDALLEIGFQNIWVLDISAMALERAKKRLGDKSHRVHWVVSDITQYQPEIKFDFWHDRAVFHFLTNAQSIGPYINIVENSVAENGHFLLGTFSENGPLKCSGLEIKQYDEAQMKDAFSNAFDPTTCFTENHITPFNTVQNFRFCGFKKRQA
jgi:SAM-dependent methyltransferase